MPQGGSPLSIVTCDRQDLAWGLWRRLAPSRWPVPAEAFPAGTALVGGAIRDGLLDRLKPHPDLDLVVAEEAISLTERLARRWRGSCVVLDAERSIARLVLAGWTIDVAQRVGESLEQDLARRDYSANAIALMLPSEGQPPTLIDPQGGLADLAAGRLRAIGEANLLDDPLRMLRGLRLAAELGFRLESGSESWIRQHANRCGSVAGERVLAELQRLAEVKAGGEAWLIQAITLGLLAPWGVPAAAAAGLAALGADAASRRGLSEPEAAWALPLARLATALNAKALAALRASRRLRQRAIRLRQGWSLLQRLEPPNTDADDPLASLTELERLRLQQQLEEDLPSWLLRWPEAAARAALQRWRDPDDPLFHPRPPLDGRRLQEALGLAPGPELGRLLEHLSLERACGRLPLTDERADEILACARLWLAEPDRRHG